MSAITTTVASITKMVSGRMEAAPLESIVGQPTLHSVRHLVEQLATFASHFATTKWGGNHWFLTIVLSKANMRLSTGKDNLYCKRLKKP